MGRRTVFPLIYILQNNRILCFRIFINYLISEYFETGITASENRQRKNGFRLSSILKRIKIMTCLCHGRLLNVLRLVSKAYNVLLKCTICLKLNQMKSILYTCSFADTPTHTHAHARTQPQITAGHTQWIKSGEGVVARGNGIWPRFPCV